MLFLLWSGSDASADGGGVERGEPAALEQPGDSAGDGSGHPLHLVVAGWGERRSRARVRKVSSCSPTAESNPGELRPGNADPRKSTRRRDTCPAACQHFSKTGEDSRGLLGIGEDNELIRNSLPFPGLTTKVAHRRHFSKTRAAGSIPAASTNLHHNASFCRVADLLGKRDD